MSFVGTNVVFLLVECMWLQTLVVGTMSPLFNICLGKPTLRTLCPVACLCSHRQKKPFADKHAVFLLVCLLLQTSSNLGSTYHITFSYPIFAWGNPHLEPFMQ